MPLIAASRSAVENAQKEEWQQQQEKQEWMSPSIKWANTTRKAAFKANKYKLSLIDKLITSKKRDYLVHFFRLLTTCWSGAPLAQSTWDNCALAHRLKKITHTLSNKTFLIWLLPTPPHLKYVATLRCNLSLIASFADVNVSQGSVGTYAKCGGMFNKHLTANLLRNLPLKKIVNRLRFDRIMVMSL